MSGTTRRAALAVCASLIAYRGALAETGPTGPTVPATTDTRSAIRAAPVDTATALFDVGGVKVLHRRNTANKVVAANLYLLGGTRQVTAENAGIEPFLLEVSERGTRHYSRDALRRAMGRLGSQIVVAPSEDWTMIGIRAVTDGFDSTWAVLADRIMHPTLDTADVEFVRAQYLSAVRQRRDDPDALIEYLADSVAWAGHAYGLAATGTERSIAALTASSLRRYHAEQFVTSRMLLVVVGNVERPRLERLVAGTLAKLPKGSYQWTPPPALPSGPSSISIERRVLPTNYILGYYAGPPASSKDYNALRIATSVLSGWLFEEIRSRRHLTYDVHAPFIERAASAGGLYVSTVSPDTTLKLMRQGIDRLRDDLVSEYGLRRIVAHFLTKYFLQNETNAEQANFLARAQLYRGDYRAGDRFVEELEAVKPEDIQRVAKQYMKNMRFAYIGDPSRVTPGVITRF